MDDASRRRRARRRAFVREHHPDAGGDPAAFIAGLARLDAGESITDAPRPVVVIRRRPTLVGIVRALVTRRQARARRLR